MKNFVIIPGCSDLNRGDQALVWETKRLMEDAGYVGQYYLTSDRNEPVMQSQNEGIKIIRPILEHPSRKFKRSNNITYSKSLKMKWGFIAVGDFLLSLAILFRPIRRLIMPFLPEAKQEAIRIFESADAIFFKGGGLLQTSGGIVSSYSMYFWTYHIRFASSLGKSILVMPNSFGPFEGPFVKRIAKKMLGKCKVATTRETYSQAMVERDLGLSLPNFPDLAFSLQKSGLSRETIQKRFDLPQNRKLVALTMRPYRFPLSDEPNKAYIFFKRQMAEFVHWLFIHDFMPVLVVHTLAVNEHEDDSACINDVIASLPDCEYRLVSDSSFDCRDLKAIYSVCNYIIGTRFHSVIFSFASNVPGLAIAYVGNKSQGIMHDIGLDDYVIDIYDVTKDELVQKFQNLVENECDVKKRIRDYNNSVKERRAALIDICKY